MADTLVLGANVFDVWVQVPPPAPSNTPNFDKKLGLLLFGLKQGFSALDKQ